MTEQLIIHSHQSTQFTSKEFTEFCESVGIKQNIGKPGYPHDNASMEGFFNTLKNKYTKEYSSKNKNNSIPLWSGLSIHSIITADLISEMGI